MYLHIQNTTDDIILMIFRYILRNISLKINLDRFLHKVEMKKDDIYSLEICATKVQLCCSREHI